MVLALVLMAMAGGLLATASFTVCGLAQQSDLEADRAVLRQMVDSGADWCRLHLADLAPGRSVTPDVSRLVPRTRTGALTRTPRTDERGVVIGARLTPTIRRSNGMTRRDSAAVAF
jgi:hypothetical protein